MEKDFMEIFQYEMERLYRERVIPVVLEQHNDKLFMYHQETWQYISSGSTVSELIEFFQERFPEKQAHIEDGDDDLIERFQQDLAVYYEGIPEWPILP